MPTLETKQLLNGLMIGESARWHDGRLWFAHWGAEEIVAVDLDGNVEVMAKGPPGLGWSIDWLPDGTLLVTGHGLNRIEPDGSMVPHADFSAVGVEGFNEIVVDGRGNIYVNGGTDFHPEEGVAPRDHRPGRPPTARHVAWPRTSRSRTAWSSRPTTRRSSSRSRSPAG